MSQDDELVLSVDADPAGVTVTAGEIDLTTAPRFRAAVDEALAAGGNLLVDLLGCEFLDSSGLSVLVDAYGALHGTGRRMVVAAVPDGPVGRVLDLTLKDVVPQAPSRGAALAILRA